jgi:putative DNA primase/helicase
MIEGCRDWQRHGLIRPDAVTAATRNYFDAQDVMGRWLKERCIIAPHLESKPAWLLKDYLDWAAKNGETVGDSRRLRGFLERTPGCEYKLRDGRQIIKGIGPRPPPPRKQKGEEVEGEEGSGGEKQ